MFLPRISQWSTSNNYYIRHDVYLESESKEFELLHVRLDTDYNVEKVTAHVPSLGMWVEFSENCHY